MDGNDLDLAALWLSPGVRQQILDADPYDRYEFTVAEGSVGALAPGRFENDPNVLVSVLGAVVGILERGRQIERGWRELAIAIGGRSVNRWRIDGESNRLRRHDPDCCLCQSVRRTGAG